MDILSKNKIRILLNPLLFLCVILGSVMIFGSTVHAVAVDDGVRRVISGPDDQPIALQCDDGGSGTLKLRGFTSFALQKYNLEKDSTSGYFDTGCGNFTSKSAYPGLNIDSSGNIAIISRTNKTDYGSNRIRIYNASGNFLREFTAKDECDAATKIQAYPIMNGDLIAYVHASCYSMYNFMIKAIDSTSGAVVFDTYIGGANAFVSLSSYENGFVVRNENDVRLYTFSGVESVTSASFDNVLDVQPTGTIVYLSTNPVNSSECKINFKDTDSTTAQRQGSCDLSFNYIESLPNGDLVALVYAGSGVARIPTIVHRDGSPDTVLDVDVPTETYNNSFRTDKVFIDANGKTVVASSYQERITLPSWPFYQDKYRAVLDIFMPDGQHQQRWNSVSLGRNKTFSPRDEQYRLTNGAIYTINNDEYPYSPTTPKLEKIAIPDISLGYREAVHWGVDGVDLSEFKTKYLALGDSYSSGEGDIDQVAALGTHYLYGTDIEGDYSNGIPKEKCHVSDRSYPFTLQLNGAIGGEGTVKSVACSGAKRVDIQGWYSEIDEDGGYLGQLTNRDDRNQPRLRGLSNIPSFQREALEDFMPGRVQQIEFVKQAKPDVVTLGVGGNDLGFDEVLRACVTKITALGTCDYATEEGRKEAGSLIKNYRMQLVDLYEAVQEASPTTRLYVVGYPQFISSSQNACGTNSSLGYSERKLITESVTYLNQVIKSAAQEAGVYYINIEDALGDHILCTITLDKYVNGVSTALLDTSESFHPNKKGHAAIADLIKDGLNGQTLKTFNDCINNTIIVCPGFGSSLSPAVPTYLDPPSTADKIVQNIDAVRDASNKVADAFRKGVDYVVQLSPNSVPPTTLVNISLHSTPVDLGDFTVAPDGSLDAEITIPSNVPAGYHTLYVTGKTSSNEDIAFRQIVKITGADQSDQDEDNVPDSQQVCGPFVSSSGVDDDLDGIDDACDSEISTDPELYRLRLGDIARTYNGSAEHADYLYIERNTRASATTGISGDYDPDGDGWAIVGVSQGTGYSPTSVPDTAPVANFVVSGSGVNAVPYVYIRAGDYGCVGLSPTNLTKVIMGQSRAIGAVSYNTDKCRQEKPGADVNSDGIADNSTELLYTARQGDGFIGEDPTRVYLFRNFYSAEAQLGISDYSPTGTPAGDKTKPIQSLNLLATNDPSDDLMLFDKLVILEDSNGKPLPTLLVKDESDQCIAYQPNDTLIIKQSTQTTRYLTKLISLPIGVSCDS